MSSPLTQAIIDHDFERCERILSQGADPNVPDEEGQLPLHTAIRQVDFGGGGEFIELLLRHGANVNKPQCRVPDSPWDVYNGETPILLTCDPRTTNPSGPESSARLAVARTLLEAGADPNARRADGESPLRLSAQADNLEMASLVLSYGADRTIDEHGGGGGLGLTALAYAASEFNVPMIELLREAGADPEALDETGETARDWLPPREEHDPKTWDRVMEMLGRRKSVEGE